MYYYYEGINSSIESHIVVVFLLHDLQPDNECNAAPQSSDFPFQNKLQVIT